MNFHPNKEVQEAKIERGKLQRTVVFMAGVVIILVGILLITVAEIKTEQTTISIPTATAMGGERDFAYTSRSSDDTLENGIIKLTPNNYVWAYPTQDYISIESQKIEYPYASLGLFTALVGIIITAFGITEYYRLYVKLLKARFGI